ncbi:MAG: hypothetical protein ACK5IB_01745 [Qingshengfaniella sp.]
MAAKDGKRGKRADEIEDAVIVGAGASEAVSPEPAPGDGADWVDGGTVALDAVLAEIPGAQVDAGAKAAPWGDPAPARATPDTAPAPEPDPSPASDPAPSAAPVPSPAPVVQKSGGGFVPAVLGGLVAAGLGFGVATYMDSGMGAQGPDPIQQALTAQGQQLGALQSQLEDLSATVAQSADSASLTAGLSDLSDRLAGQVSDVSGRIGETLGGVGDRLDGIAERLTAVERRPLTESSETAQQAFDGYQREIDALRAALADAETRISTLTEDLTTARTTADQQVAAVQTQVSAAQQAAAAEMTDAALRTALARITGALDSGRPYSEALSGLPDTIAVPQALADHADSGVATLAQLRTRFPAAARAALDAAIKTNVSDDLGGRLLAFVRTQTGARSLAPRSGGDPDAILSRAEAALAQGDLSAALDEIATLPDSGQQAMADWVEQARTRQAVTDAKDQLAATVTGE